VECQRPAPGFINHHRHHTRCSRQAKNPFANAHHTACRRLVPKTSRSPPACRHWHGRYACFNPSHFFSLKIVTRCACLSDAAHIISMAAQGKIGRNKMVSATPNDTTSETTRQARGLDALDLCMPTYRDNVEAPKSQHEIQVRGLNELDLCMPPLRYGVAGPKSQFDKVHLTAATLQANTRAPWCCSKHCCCQCHGMKEATKDDATKITCGRCGRLYRRRRPDCSDSSMSQRDHSTQSSHLSD
jgi:hypothetical protein